MLFVIVMAFFVVLTVSTYLHDRRRADGKHLDWKEYFNW